jgi:hypothetical protein
MGMWSGIAQGMESVQQRKLEEQRLEMAEEDFNLRKRAAERADAAFSLQEQQARLDLYKIIRGKFGNLKSGSGSETETTATKNLTKNMSVLVTRFGIDQAEVAKVYKSGGAEAIAEAAKLAVTYGDKFKTGEYTGDAPNIVVGQMLADAIYTESETAEYDWDEISESIGVEVDDTLRDMLGNSYEIPGAVAFTAPALVKKPTFADLDAADKRGIMNVEAQSRAQSRIILARINTLNTKEDVLSKAEEAELAWLAERQRSIREAQEAFKSDVYTPLIELFGSSYIDTVTDYYGNLEGAPLNPAFTEASQIAVPVPNRAVAENLFLAGILKPGMKVVYLETGEVVPLGE